MRVLNLKNNSKCLIDDEDYFFAQHLTWSLDGSGRYVIARKRINGKRQVFLLHRFILGLKDPLVFVDHIDRNPLNNCRSNLRICDNTLNQGNRVANKNKKTGKFKGVYFRAKKNAFVSEITFRGKRFYLGFFKKEIDAAKAYDKRARELFGKFALLNLA